MLPLLLLIVAHLVINNAGKTTTVRAFCEMAFDAVGLPLRWQGSGLDEVGGVLPHWSGRKKRETNAVVVWQRIV